MVKDIVYVLIFLISMLLNIKWVHHILKAVPLRRSGVVDKTHLKIALYWFASAVVFFILVQAFI